MPTSSNPAQANPLEANQLGEYLRARRELVTPEDAGIPVLGMRRVPGLRREEVAMLAGISAEYYLRLEQGRDRNPSIQVLEALARVLQLDEEMSLYLLSLAADKPRTVRRRPRKETVPASTRQLLAALPFPSFVEGRYLDVLAANRFATAISPRLVVGGNRLRDVFLDPAERALFPYWDRAAAASSPGSGNRSEPTPTTRASSNSSGSSPSRAPGSRSSGPAMTWRGAAALRCSSTTRSSVSCWSTAKSSRSRVPTA